MDLTVVTGLLFILMTIQAIGTYVQVQQYKKAVRRLRRLGNVGIGSKRGRLRSGNIVVLVCDGDGRITGGEILEGLTIFNDFRELKGIVGRTIYDLRSEYDALPGKQQQYYKAHMQALDALYMRLHSKIEEKMSIYQ